MRRVSYIRCSFLIAAFSVVGCSGGTNALSSIPRQFSIPQSKSAAQRDALAHNLGAISEYPVPTLNSLPGKMALGSDGNVWFSEIRGSKIAYVKPSGAIVEYAVARRQNSVTRVVRPELGPDRRMWFAVRGNNEGFLGSVEQDGSITYFDTPGEVNPQSPVAGADGKIWFSETDKNAVASITELGAITEFALPTPNAGPWSVSLGPDRAIWFSESNVGRIGRISESGVITEFPLSDPNSQPDSLMAGPDGNLWFAEATTDGAIDRMTTSGVVTRFPLPINCDNNIFVNIGMAWGPHRMLYFTCPGLGEIGRLARDGTMRFFPIPTPNSGPGDVELGSDGNIWFTESGANKIGVLRFTHSANDTDESDN